MLAIQRSIVTKALGTVHISVHLDVPETLRFALSDKQ
jgi:hypothetical protein